MKIIELVGLPGSGKSTTMRKLFAKNEVMSNSTFINPLFASKSKLLLGALISFISYPQIVVSYTIKIISLCKCIKTGARTVAWKIGIFEILQFAYCYRWICCNNEVKYVYSDQWVYQHLFSMLHDANIADYKSRISSIDAFIREKFADSYELVICDLPLDENMRRITKRVDGQSVLDDKPEDEIKRIFKIQKSNIKKMQTYCKVKRSLLDMSQPIDNVLKQVITITNK